MLAEAQQYELECLAEGRFKTLLAESRGLEALRMASGFDQTLTLATILKDHLIQLAEAQAKAVHGSNPKIHVWNIGDSNKNQQAGDALINLTRTMAPLVDGLFQQTGVSNFMNFGNNNSRTDLMKRNDDKDLIIPPLN